MSSLVALSLLKESRPMRIHLIGVAGSGMSGLAHLLLAQGHKVSGCDKATTQETQRLQELGLKFQQGHRSEEVEGCDLVIYSSAIKPGNAAYEAAYKQGIPLVKRAEALAAILSRQQGIVVSGTHGKTTTSALAAHVLRQGGLNPSHYVGAEIPILGSNAQWNPQGKWFVAEGDESDGTLALFRPAYSIVLNIEAEHLDFYSDLNAIKAVFSQLLSQTSTACIYCAEDPVAREVCSGQPAAISYGWNQQHDFHARILSMQADHSTFEVSRRDELLGCATLGIPGRHNVSNAMAVIALAISLGMNFEDIAIALQSFRGARRRFEIRHRGPQVTLVDDYGHHPSEVAATLCTAQGLSAKRIACVFQPHRFSRTQLLKQEFGAAFDAANLLLVTDIYPASEKPLPGISGQTILDEVRAHDLARKSPRRSEQLISAPSLIEARNRAGNLLRPGDLLLTLGAGNVHEIARSLAADLPLLEEIWALLAAHGGGDARMHEPLNRHTTFLIGGPAQYWIEPHGIEGFARVVSLLRARKVPIRVIGRGSNLLVRDGGIRGAVIHPAKGEFAEIRVEGELLHVAAGVRLKKIAATARNAGLGDLEWMEGIPGNLGGAIRMNAGAMGWEMADNLVSVTYLDDNGCLKEKNIADIDHRYRSIPEFETNLIVSAVLRGRPCAVDGIDQALEASRNKRRLSQPIGASAGCIFKNPQALGAGQLIEQLGLKGSHQGAAKVSAAHGNFIVNGGGAKAGDVLDLVAQIRNQAREQRSIELELEVKVLGEDEAQAL